MVSGGMPAGVKVIPALTQIDQQPVVTGGAAHTLQIHRGNAEALQKGFGTGEVIEAVATAIGKAIISTTEPIGLVRASGVLNVLEDILINFICLFP